MSVNISIVPIVVSVLNDNDDDIEDDDDTMVVVVVVRIVLDDATTDRRIVEVGPNTGDEMVVMGVVTSENASTLHQINVRPSLLL